MQAGKPVDMSGMMHILENMNAAQIYPQMEDAIKCIRAEGIKTALLTNNWFINKDKDESLLPIDTSLFDEVSKCPKLDAHINR